MHHVPAGNCMYIHYVHCTCGTWYMVHTSNIQLPLQYWTTMSSEVLCLGRPFHLGMLYNCCTEETVPGLNLWDIKKLEEEAITNDKVRNVQQEVILEDTIEEKTRHFGANAEMNLSLLSGLVKAGGSAGYIYDRVTSKQQARATLKYHCSSGFKTVQDLKAHLCKGTYESASQANFNGATHVVTQLEYGSDAFFVFNRSMDEKEKKDEVAAEMKAALDCIPKGGAGAGMGAKYEHKFKERNSSYHCMYYGNFNLDSNPTTFDEAVEAYKKLSTTKLADIPWKAQLIPLADALTFYGRKCDIRPIVRITEPLTYKVKDVLEKINKDKITLLDLRNHETCEKFKSLKEVTKKFVKKNEAATSVFKVCVSKWILEIRRSEATETGLKAYIARPTNDHAELVKNKISQFTDYLEKIERNPSIMIVGKVETQTDHVALSLAFNDALNVKVSGSKNERQLQNSSTSAIFQQYLDFVERNCSKQISFFVTEKFLCDGNKKTATIVHENDQAHIFEIPSQPAHFTVTPLPSPQGAIKLKWQCKKTRNIVFYTVCYKNGRTAVDERTRGAAQTILIANLRHKKEYQFKVQAVTKLGVGPEAIYTYTYSG